MRSISIQARFQPFTHTPGAKVFIPYTAHWVQIFPTRLIFSDEIVVDLPLLGPVEDFTCTLDLDRGRIAVHGKSVEGYFKYYILKEETLEIRPVKGPIEQKSIPLPEDFGVRRPVEHLSFGVSKKLDWERVLKRGEMEEILPLSFLLGQQLVDAPFEDSTARDLVQSLPKSFDSLLKLSYRALLFTLTEDDLHQGISLESKLGKPSPGVHVYLYKMLRRWLVIEEKSSLLFLQELPGNFKVGRATSIQVEGAVIELEWTKGKLRRLILKGTKDRSVTLIFPRVIKCCRLKQSHREKGIAFSNGQELQIKKDVRYHFDRFDK